MRKPNAICMKCGAEFYRRPSQAAKYNKAFCSMKCFGASKVNPDTPCEGCKKPFHGKRKEQRFCSAACASKRPRPRTGKYAGTNIRNPTSHNLAKLHSRFEFSTCMVEGCTYARTFDVHRLIPGVAGGKYEVGNMFALCPNHHAEIHRKIATAEKVSDCCIRLIYGEMAELDKAPSWKLGVSV